MEETSARSSATTTRTQRTRQRSNALKSAAPWDSDEPRHPPRFGGDRCSARSARGLGCGTPRPLLRERPGWCLPATFASEPARGIGSIARHRHRCFGFGGAGRFSRDNAVASASVRGVCSVMWGSASADRSLTASGFLPRTPSPTFGSDPGYSGLATRTPRSPGACPGSRRNPPGRPGSATLPSGRGSRFPGSCNGCTPLRFGGGCGRHAHRLRSAPRAGQDGNDRKATARSDACPAADEGNSSEGAKCTAGIPASGVRLRANSQGSVKTKRSEPSAGCGVQQTRNSSAEKTVEVVRNHEGGTRTGTWRRRSDGSFGSPELTRGRYIGGRVKNPKRGGTNARRFQRFHERSEGEAKVTRVAFPRLRPREADVTGIPRRSGPATVQGHGGARGRPTTRSPDRPSEKRGTPKVRAAPATLKTHPTPES
jgi:hypothetical protein